MKRCRVDERQIMAKKSPSKRAISKRPATRVVPYDTVLTGVVELLELSRRASARAVNAIMTATYWEVGRRIVEVEQQGRKRAGYGDALVKRLSVDLTKRFGRGFSRQNLERFRKFFQTYSLNDQISSTAWSISAETTIEANSPAISAAEEKCSTAWSISSETQKKADKNVVDLIVVPKTTASSIRRTGQQIGQPEPSPMVMLKAIAAKFPLPWSHYRALLSVKNPLGRQFYETEALRGGWTVRQLERQIDTQFYERTALSRNKVAMLRKGQQTKPEDLVTADEEIRDSLLLEFLNLKDEYSESDLEEALIEHLEAFLLELGGDFTFVGRQRRLRIGDEWFRVDLVFFHRVLRCLVIVDLKLGKFTHADSGQMQLYLNYAREHWTRPGENPPVGLILCATKNDALAKYALGDLADRVLIREYQTALPSEESLVMEIEETWKRLESQDAKRRANTQT